MSVERDQQKQKGGRGGQQGGGGQKPGQQQQAEVDKKEKGGARSARNRTSRTKSRARGAWCPATINPLKRRFNCRGYCSRNAASAGRNPVAYKALECSRLTGLGPIVGTPDSP